MFFGILSLRFNATNGFSILKESEGKYIVLYNEGMRTFTVHRPFGIQKILGNI